MNCPVCDNKLCLIFKVCEGETPPRGGSAPTPETPPPEANIPTNLEQVASALEADLGAKKALDLLTEVFKEHADLWVDRPSRQFARRLRSAAKKLLVSGLLRSVISPIA